MGRKNMLQRMVNKINSPLIVNCSNVPSQKMGPKNHPRNLSKSDLSLGLKPILKQKMSVTLSLMPRNIPSTNPI